MTSADPTGGRRAWERSHIDGAGANSNSINGVSCPSRSLCVGVDNYGNAVTSRNPTGGRGAWRIADIDPSNQDYTTQLWGVSCPSISFCVAIDDQSIPSAGDTGGVSASSNPTDGASAWQPFAEIDSSGDSPNGLTTVSCSSRTFCIAMDASGPLFTSTDPASRRSVWVPSEFDGGNEFDGLSCPSRSLCVLVDSAGNVLTSTNPAAGAR